MKVKARLTIDIEYEVENERYGYDEKYINESIIDRLHNAAEHLDSEGMLSNNIDDVTVNAYSSEVKLGDQVNYTFQQRLQGRDYTW